MMEDIILYYSSQKTTTSSAASVDVTITQRLDLVLNEWLTTTLIVPQCSVVSMITPLDKVRDDDRRSLSVVACGSGAVLIPRFEFDATTPFLVLQRAVKHVFHTNSHAKLTTADETSKPVIRLLNGTREMIERSTTLLYDIGLANNAVISVVAQDPSVLLQTGMDLRLVDC